MPRFSEQERNRINQCLLEEGEHLFTAYGIRKVTIDDIVKAVSIAKASFYKFYEGKEYLFLEIAQKRQKEIFDVLEHTLEDSKGKADGEKIKLVFYTMSVLMRKYPILASINKETAELIARKVSPERLAEYSKQGLDAVKVMENHGIKFCQKTEVVSKVFQTLYLAWISLQEQPEEMQRQVIDIMLEGVIEQIV